MSLEELVSDSAARKRSGTKINHFIVAIGASAGGLEAIHEFFDNMPENSNLSFVVIQHLSPDYKSLLVELVSKHTHMKVFEAEDGMTVHKECVYIIPNKKLMTIKEGKLLLTEKGVEKAPNTAIDYFLKTLAEDKKEQAIAIILSGTGTDGTKGVDAIKHCGGMVIVQDPVTAKFDGMPNSAITSGNADFILPPEMMPEEIYNHIQEKPIHVLNKGKIDDEQLAKIFSHIYKTNGYDFHYYKTPTIIRRIGKRMGQKGFKRLNDYVNFLQQDPDESTRLSKDFLIGVTRFFRDEPAFECLSKEVLPSVMLNKAEDDIVKVWVCACSTGEEAYSIAVVIDRFLRSVGRKNEVKIFATDIDDANIDFAARNCYPESIEKDIDSATLKDYFVKNGSHYSLIPRIRKQIVFARHNVIKDPPFIKNDLVSCRNMLIYMNNVLQQKVLATLHFSLNVEGFLFLGPSETVNSIRDNVLEVNSKWKIFRKISKAKSQPHEMYRPLDGKSHSARPLPFPKVEKLKANSLSQDFTEAMIEEFGYVCFYLDQNFEIKETGGNYSRFLSLPEKKLTLNILKMVPQELSVALNTAVRRSWKENRKIFLKSVRIRSGETDQYVSISVTPPRPTDGKPNTLVILGEHLQSHVQQKEDSNILSSTEQNQYVSELETELSEARSNLQMAIEGLETTNEELQSSNEELLSANEELQSSNEELQSLNEELHTLNTEHQLKIKELIELNDDLNNFFRSTDIGQIFLDSNLRIRKFNHAVISMINLIDSDIGRPINHISTNIQYEHLLVDLNNVINSGLVVEREVKLYNDNQCLMKIMPYIRQDNKQDGAIITFVDISAVNELSNIINGVFNSSLSAIVAFKAIRNQRNEIIDFELQTANKAFEEFFNVKLPASGQKLSQLKDVAPGGFMERYIDIVEKNVSLHNELRINNPESEKWLELVAVKMTDGFVATFTDITGKRAAELKLKSNYNELIEVRENLKKLNIELESKVESRTRELYQSEERFRLVSKATNDAIWDWNLVDNNVWWSDSFYTLFDHPRDENTLNSDFWLENIHPDDRDRVYENINDVINSKGDRWTQEYRFRRADGTYAFILDRGNLLLDEYGTPYRMLGSMLDISALKEAEQKLRSSEARFRKVFDSNMVGMVFTDANGTILSANQAFLEMLGYSQEELKRGEITWQVLTPPGSLKNNALIKQQLRENGVSSPIENEYYHKNGNKVSVLLGAASVDEEEAIAVTYVIDITEKKQAEELELRLQRIIANQQEEFKSIFYNAPALISIRRGPQLTVEFINKAVSEYFGRTDLLGKTGDELLAEYNAENRESDDLVKEVYRTGEPYFGKAFHMKLDLKRDGNMQDLWFDFVYQPVYDVHGQVDGVATFAFDVSDMMRANEEIKKNEERFRFLANTMPQKVWTATPEGDMDYFNKVYLDYTGLQSSDLTGNGWWRIVHPEDLDANRKQWAASMATGEVFEMERRLLNASGEYRWHLSRGVPHFDESGKISMWVGTSTDIHEQKNVSEALKESEDYFRQLSDEAPFMIWKVDETGLCSYVNKHWIETTGLSYEESMGTGWTTILHPADAENEQKNFIDAFGKRLPYDSKFRLKFRDEKYHWVMSQSNAILRDGFEGYIGCVTDIHEQEMAQQALKILMQKKDEFMSIASHELKTPITSMKGSLQIAARLAKRNADIKEIYSFIEKANKQINRLTGLVDDLLDVTKITAGRLEFHLSRFPIGEAIQDCLDQIENNENSHRILVKGDRNILVQADRHRLDQVITNFLSNAIKYSPDADEVILNISKETDFLKISVTDFGIGIPENKRDFVFDRFFRVQESSAKFSGLGLGLFISAEIIKRHGGKVGVTSQEDKGSTFWFTLPLSNT